MYMFCFVSSVQFIVNGLGFVHVKVPFTSADCFCGLCTYLLDSLWAPGPGRGWTPPSSVHLCTAAPPALSTGKLTILASSEAHRGLLSAPFYQKPRNRASFMDQGFFASPFCVSLKTQVILMTRQVASVRHRKEIFLSVCSSTLIFSTIVLYVLGQ
jgi:hypothetical protein